MKYLNEVYDHMQHANLRKVSAQWWLLCFVIVAVNLSAETQFCVPDVSSGRIIEYRSAMIPLERERLSDTTSGDVMLCVASDGSITNALMLRSTGCGQIDRYVVSHPDSILVLPSPSEHSGGRAVVRLIVHPSYTSDSCTVATITGIQLQDIDSLPAYDERFKMLLTFRDGHLPDVQEFTPFDVPVIAATFDTIPVGEKDSTTGPTWVSVLVDTSGAVLDAKLTRSSGSTACDDLALKTARKTEYNPAVYAGFPVTSWVSLKLTNFQDAVQVSQSHPLYPQEAAIAGKQGTVFIASLVGVDGLAIQSKIDSTSGEKSLDQAALIASVKCTYLPAKRDGVAVPNWVRYKVVFLSLIVEMIRSC